jgi:hypothetical protein
MQFTSYEWVVAATCCSNMQWNCTEWVAALLPVPPPTHSSATTHAVQFHHILLQNVATHSHQHHPLIAAPPPTHSSATTHSVPFHCILLQNVATHSHQCHHPLIAVPPPTQCHSTAYCYNMWQPTHTSATTHS